MDNRASLSFIRVLITLRWLAVAGQAGTLWVVSEPMGVTLPMAPLWGGVAALAAFNLFVWWRARTRQEAGEAVVFGHILADIASLTWMIAFSGGIENPFSSLFLLPIALSILALPGRWLWAAAAASLLGYLISAVFARELHHHVMGGMLGDAFSLHKAGMMVNFLVSALVVLLFFTRMAREWRQSEREVARLREKFARDEGIVALATHAASVAHELNTPLGTLTLMVEDLASEAQTPQQREDAATMKALLEVCRDRVRELAAPADAKRFDQSFKAADLERVIERWQLVRPTVELRRSGDAVGAGHLDPAVGHLLQALLNNAADASEAAGGSRVDLDIHTTERTLQVSIRDYGPGFEHSQPILPGTLFRTAKPDGLGIGLVLSHATVERLGGNLSMQPAQTGPGVLVSFEVPAGHGA